MEETKGQKKGDILAVDDKPENLKLLNGLLKERNYNVRPVPNGRLAITAAQAIPPDLILLDIMMPGMDGFEVLEELQKDTRTREIPVIFLTARNDMSSVVNALNSGAVDYITKPFQIPELLARVNTHIKLRKQQQELKELNASKDLFFSILSHDLRGSVGSLSAVFNDVLKPGEVIEHAFYHSICQSTSNLYRFLDELLNWAKCQKGQLEKKIVNFSVDAIIRDVFQVFEGSALKKEIQLKHHNPDNIFIRADMEMSKTVLRNLVANAIKFSYPGSTVFVSAETKEDKVTISVTDQGVGMKPEQKEKLFKLGEKGVSTPGTAKEKGTGFGLILCSEFIANNDGEMGIESVEGKGSRFWFSLPQGK